MSKWLNKYNCPGFVFCPRKPWPFGNEWHTIACSMSMILFMVEIVEGKDHPKEMPEPRHNRDENNRLHDTTYTPSRKVLYFGFWCILDSGFCVLAGIILLAHWVVYASAVIKKRRYWPKYIKGDEIKAHFANKPVGSFDALPGTLNGILFHLYGMKEEDYIMSLMSTYGTDEMTKEVYRRISKGTPQEQTVSFRLNEVIRNHLLDGML